MDEILVGTIVNSEVAVATNMAVAGLTPAACNTKYNTGTMTMPPPTPSKPARIPAKAPVIIMAIMVGSHWLQNSFIDRRPRPLNLLRRCVDHLQPPHCHPQ